MPDMCSQLDAVICQTMPQPIQCLSAMITILVPAFNEAAVIEAMIRDLHRRLTLTEPYELLIVDDGSTDATPAILDALARDDATLRVLHHERNQGLGAALATGFHLARGRIIVTMDADQTHPPEMIAPLVAACTGDFAVGSRYIPGGGMVGVPWLRVVLSQVANGIFRLLFATPLRDITSGFKAYSKACVEQLTVVSPGFDAQLEITMRLVKQGKTFQEVPYQLRNREQGESKMRYLRLIPRYTRTLCNLLKYRWNLGKTPYDG